MRSLMLAGMYRRQSWTWGPGSADEIDVAMCLWNRPSRIIPILEMIDGQTTSRPIRLRLWNNNRSDHAHYAAEIARFQPRGALSRVDLAKTLLNVGSIGRFYWARQIVRRRPGGYLVVLDDDQVVDHDFVARAAGAGRADAVVAWWSWVVEGEYHLRRRARPGDEVTHIGPGGSVLPVQLVSTREFFTRIPDKFRMLDDVWLSYYARRRDYRLMPLQADIEFVMDETNQFHGQKDLKSEFYEYLYGPGSDERKPRLTP